jgi:type VI secretion system protein ImpL
MSNFLHNLIQAIQPFLQGTMIVTFAVAIAIMFIAGALLIRNLRLAKRERAAAKKGAATGNAQASGSYLQVLQQWAQGLFGWVSKARNAYQNAPRDDMAQSFEKVIEVLKGYLGPSQPQYKLPWYMVIGAQGAGKTTFLDGANLELPIGSPVDEITGPAAPLSWKFFDQAIVADVSGKFILDPKTNSSDEESWSYLLNLFKYYRAKRPLDGIILTIPADEVTGETQFTKEQIIQRGRVLYAKLWKMQNLLGMRIPIYVVVTKSDKIAGFSSFVQQLPEEKRQEIFGWSSPYEIYSAFSSEWLETLFKSLRRNLNRLRAAVFTREIAGDARMGNAVLPIEIKNMQETLGLYLNEIFKESSYHDSFFLRGVYFTGYGDNTAALNFFLESKTQGNKNPELGQQVFIRDLLLKKIFQEYPLAEPNTRLLVSINKGLNSVKIFSGALAAVWILGMVQSARQFNIQNQSLLPVLQLIDHSIVGANERLATGNDAKSQNFLNAQSTQLLEEFVSVDSVNTFSLFLPASWFSLLDEKVQASFTAAYDRIILPSIYGALLDRLYTTVAQDSGVQVAPPANQAVPNPLDAMAYKKLERYINDLYELESNIEAFNQLETTTSINAIGRLIKYLFGRDLPMQFFNNTDYYRKALARITDKDVKVAGYIDAAQQKLRILYRNFLLETFDINQNFPVLMTLQKEMDAIALHGAYKKMDEKDMWQLAEKAISFADLLTSGKVTWLSKRLFDPGAGYNPLMDKVAASKLLGLEIAGELSRVADIALGKYRLDLSKISSELTGPFFQIENGDLIAEPSASFINFIDAVKTFLGESFMAPVGRYDILFTIQPGRLLFWDDGTLQKGQLVLESYENFAAKHLADFPQNLHPLFREVGRNAVRKKVANFIALAQSFQPEPLGMTGFGLRELLTKQVNNIATVTPQFNKILGVFADGAYVVTTANLRELLVNQSYGLLQKIDNLLKADNLYSANEEELRWWKGEPLVGFKLFHVSDSNDMKAYLAAQRFRIQFLAQEMARPLLMLLGQDFLAGVPKNMPLINKWKRIIDVLEDYEKKTPGNSLSTLETFLTEDLNTINIENCLDKVGDFDQYIHSGDYFLEIRNHYYHKVEKRCEAIGFKEAIDFYNAASSFFNANLAGRFPFSKDVDNPASPEADADDVLTFFKLFDQLKPQHLEMLKHASRTAGADQSLAKFIREIESIRPLMLASLDAGSDKHIPAVTLNATFRTDRHREQGGDHIIDWSLTIAGEALSMQNPSGSVEWRIGRPIDMMVKWAQNGEIIPLPDSRLPSLTVSGPHALFSYEGRWALARLLRDHVTPEATFNKDASASAHLLEFAIPTAFNPNCYRRHEALPPASPNQPARLYMRLTMAVPVMTAVENATPKEHKPETVSSKKLQPLSVPSFPYHAPLYRPS